MTDKSVSVIVPTFNRAHLIERSLRSVLDQTVPVAEVIVVDDGSTDATMDVLEAMQRSDSRITILRQERRGAPAARNAGLAAARGSLIAFQDSDDVWEPTFVEELSVFHDRPGRLAFSSMVTFSPGGSSRVDFPETITNVERVLTGTNCISTQTVLADAGLFTDLAFDESLPRLQDWDLWLGLLGRAQFAHCSRPLVRQYLQTDSITAGGVSLYVALRIITKKHWRVMARRPLRFGRLWLAARIHTPRGLAR